MVMDMLSRAARAAGSTATIRVPASIRARGSGAVMASIRTATAPTSSLITMETGITTGTFAPTGETATTTRPVYTPERVLGERIRSIGVTLPETHGALAADACSAAHS